MDQCEKMLITFWLQTAAWFKPRLILGGDTRSKYLARNWENSRSNTEGYFDPVCHLRVNSQFVRLQKLERIVQIVSDKRDSAALSSLVACRKDVEYTYALYEKEHAFIEVACPASFSNNDYFQADFHNAVTTQC